MSRFHRPATASVAATTLTFIFAASASAQTPAPPATPTELDDVVVTATATRRTLQDAPATISVVTRDDLLRRPVQDLTDVLRDVPGVTINGAGLTRRGVSVRGMPSEHTLFLVDS